MSRSGPRWARRRTQAAWAAALAARSTVAGHPRHLVLAGVVAGLLAGPVWAPGVVIAALAALWLGGRPGVALIAAAGALGGAVLADARLTALNADPGRAMLGERVDASAVLLEPVRERPTGLRAARMRLVDGPAAGAVTAARIQPGTPWPGDAHVGDVLRLGGRLVALARYEAYQRRRGAHEALSVQSARATGKRRGGLAGVLDGARGRAERALATGVRPAEAGLLRGMVLGQDEGIEEPVREEFRRSGLAHLLTYYHLAITQRGAKENRVNGNYEPGNCRWATSQEQAGNRRPAQRRS